MIIFYNILTFIGVMLSVLSCGVAYLAKDWTFFFVCIVFAVLFLYYRYIKLVQYQEKERKNKEKLLGL